jgi:hypothetical protein
MNYKIDFKIPGRTNITINRKWGHLSKCKSLFDNKNSSKKGMIRK